MAIKLTTKPNTDPVSGPWPFGKIRDDDGSGNGTEVNTEVYGDIHQFFESMMAYALVVANDDPDNATNGFQFLEALQKAISKRISTRITAGNDLDNDLIVGIFSVESSGIANGPSGFTGDGQLIITDDGTDLRQRLVEMGRGFEWTRTFNGSVWSSWTVVKNAIKILSIGDWDMDATPAVNVAHGLTFSKIRGYTVMIIGDTNPYTSDFSSGGSVVFSNATEFRLARTDSGIFDSTNYDGAGNRGYITVIYEP